MAPSAHAAPSLPPFELEIALNDDDFAALTTTERDFALRWVRMTDEEQDWFCRNLLAAIEVLQRLGALEPPQAADGMVPGLPG
jgi:hypothetical protein